MQVEGKIDGQPLIILINSGSTHSFVDESLIRKLRVPIENKANLQVTVANGEEAVLESIKSFLFSWDKEEKTLSQDRNLNEYSFAGTRSTNYFKPACVNEVASAMTKGTFTTRAKNLGSPPEHRRHGHSSASYKPYT
ncbi:hypothetical protein Ccrd_024339 [Cynara cardunculus var. scolymus]|uniref:Uncharacterized protein n=1 Tax=Cynara cardunculus var. scolymus TaxID=59895 RepID=A0A103XCL4_CYNCS|nr:hypothetical protein Ccrd_024339 [Cynara cardunculus var. scolymus]